MKLLLVLSSVLLGLFAKSATAQMSSQMPNSSGQIPASLSISSCPSGSVDMSIRNGMSGQLVPDAIEATKGAVTVANRNDTDGDGVEDYQDPFVAYLPSISIPNADPFPAYPTGSDIDLMIVTLHRPVSIVPNEKVYLKKTKSGNGLKAWRYPSKSKEILFSKIVDGMMAAEFSVEELPVTLYVEALDYSEKRDIEFAMKYGGEEDIVSATAIWVENTRIWKTREECAPLPDCFGGENPKAGNGRLLGLDEGFLKDLINVDRVSKDGSRYGHGYNSKAPINSEDMGFGGRVLFEYAILPTNTDLLEFNIKFDCTRRRETRSMKTKHGDIPGNVEIGGTSYMDFPSDSDEANDDGDFFDEDNIPTKPDGSNEWRIYAWDRPGITNIVDGGNTYSFWATKNNFEEYVRVKFDGIFSSNGNGLYGSRVTSKTKWHCVYYTKSGTGNKLEPDMQPISFSNPKKVGPGNGSCMVETFSAAFNSVYTAYYIPSTAEWGLARKHSGEVAKANVIQGSDPRQWILNLSGIIRVTITEGTSIFGENSRYEFSVFKTSSEKINRTDIGPITIDSSF